ncbi:MAG: hypothetical protein ACE5D2_06230 [Fidelibacterota bacterium]
MMELILTLRVIHIITAILMAWPFYALVAVNQRVRLGPPLGDRTDTYMENIVKNRTIPCFVFQATALITGVALMYLRGMGLGALFTDVMLGLKFWLLLLIGGLLTYVHISLQPRIDALFAQLGTGNGAEETAKEIGSLRLRRKRFATVCMFVVLLVAMFGVQVWEPFPVWLTIVMVIAIGLFTWRAYSSETSYGWV